MIVGGRYDEKAITFIVYGLRYAIVSSACQRIRGTDKTDAPGEVTATKTLFNKEPDTDGNYTIQLTVQGNPITQESHSAADVVLVVDNSESMNDSVVERCNAPKTHLM